MSTGLSKFRKTTLQNEGDDDVDAMIFFLDIRKYGHLWSKRQQRGRRRRRRSSSTRSPDDPTLSLRTRQGCPNVQKSTLQYEGDDEDAI